nr:hypothetical protein [uncultured Halomonas sp.]
MTHMTRLVIVSLLLFTVSSPALAYIGPGAGLSLLGALWGLVAAVGAALLFVLLWPFRRMMRRKREAKKAEAESQQTAQHRPISETTTPNTTTQETTERETAPYDSTQAPRDTSVPGDEKTEHEKAKHSDASSR